MRWIYEFPYLYKTKTAQWDWIWRRTGRHTKCLVHPRCSYRWCSGWCWGEWWYGSQIALWWELFGLVGFMTDESASCWVREDSCSRANLSICLRNLLDFDSLCVCWAFFIINLFFVFFCCLLLFLGMAKLWGFLDFYNFLFSIFVISLIEEK